METQQTPLSAPQLELLQLFSRPVDEQHWREIKQLITAYFARKAVEEADRVWDEQGWDDAKIEELLNTHLRTPYSKA